MDEQEEEKKGAVRKGSKKSKRTNKNPPLESDETMIGTCAVAAKTKQIITLNELQANEVYYLVYKRSKSDKEMDLESKVSPC